MNAPIVILIGVSVVALFSACGSLSVQPERAPNAKAQTFKAANRDSLIAKVNRVRLLSFDTDKPVSEVRLVVDGKQVGSDSWQSGATGFKLAVIIPPHVNPSRPNTSREVEVHVEVPGMGGFMAGPYRDTREAQVQQREYFGRGGDLVLTGWTQVYGMTHALRAKVLYDLKIEIR